MKALLLNSPQSPCPYTHYAACTEFLEGFRAYGFEPGVATSIEGACGATLLLLSSHAIDMGYIHSLNTATPDTIFLLWFYFDRKDELPFKRFILTGEHWLHAPKIPLHLRLYNLIPHLSNYVPFLLRANEDPARIGTYPRTERYNGCFIGTPYKREWTVSLPNTLYHNITHSGLLPYAARRDIYLSSRIAFGFHSLGNILNSHATQRVFEGLSYGCVVLTDNPAAEEITGGVVIYVSSKADFLEKYNYYLTHPDECRKKELEGYEWSKQYGTNRYAASLFIKKIEELNESSGW
jgi:spore maturation protein CgeB